jgi:hypothetical protein
MSTTFNVINSERIYSDFELQIKCSIELVGENKLPADFAHKIKNQLYDVEAAVGGVVKNIERYLFREIYERSDELLRTAIKTALSSFQSVVHLVPVTNEYHGHKPDEFAYGNEPWYEIPTHVGILKVGHRKRVYQFDWVIRSNLKKIK